VSSAVLPSTSAARGHHVPAAVLTVVAVGLLAALPELLGDLGRLAAVLVLQLALVLVWVLVTGVQGFAGSLAVGVAASVAADLAIVLPAEPELGALLAVLGLAFLAVVVQQMARSPRTDLVAALSTGLLLCVVVATMAVWLLLGRVADDDGGRTLVAVLAVGAAVLVGHLVDAVLPRPQLAEDVPRGLLGLGAAVLAAVGVAVLGADRAELLDVPGAVLFGGALGVVAALTAVAASYVVVDSGAAPAADDDERVGGWVAPVLQVVLPLAACAPVALALHTAL
jgi:hypothetical protein